MTTKFQELSAGDVSDEEHDPKNAMSRSDTKEFVDDCIDAINKYRKKHSADKYAHIAQILFKISIYFLVYVRYRFGSLILDTYDMQRRYTRHEFLFRLAYNFDVKKLCTVSYRPQSQHTQFPTVSYGLHF